MKFLDTAVPITDSLEEAKEEYIKNHYNTFYRRSLPLAEGICSICFSNTIDETKKICNTCQWVYCNECGLFVLQFSKFEREGTIISDLNEFTSYWTNGHIEYHLAKGDNNCDCHVITP